MSDKEIQKVISDYLNYRQKFLDAGNKYPELIGGNDNIIGRIGEYYAMKYLTHIGQNPVKVDGKSNQGYDLMEGNVLTQVKVLTIENKKGRSVRLKKPWTQLLLITLGENYEVECLGLLTEKQHETALKENKTWAPNPIVKISMLGDKGLIGKYGNIDRSFKINT